MKISRHASQRWAEFDTGRHLQDELQSASPFGAQRGDDRLLLLPCGYVAAVSGDGVVKTILRYEHAVANMQSHGLDFTASPPGRRRTPLHILAAQHVLARLPHRDRMKGLRDEGYDPTGPEGDVYRVALEAALMVMARRDE